MNKDQNTYLKEELETLDCRLETWRPVVGQEGRYEVSDNGRVRSLKYRGLKGVVVVLKTFITRGGYELVQIGIDRKRFTIHSLVMDAFVGPRPDGDNIQINHKDGNKLNNRFENLEYLTASENRKHAFATGLSNQNGSRNPVAKLSEENVREIRAMIKLGFSQGKIAKKFNVSQSRISSIATGNTWSHLP